MQLVIDWQISAFFGWGVYGLNLALELGPDRTIEARASRPHDLRQIGIDTIRAHALGPFLTRSNGGPPPRGAAWLQSMGNDFPAPLPQTRLGVIFFEGSPSREAIERLKRYDVIVTGSTWNEELLKAAGLPNIRTILQGVDRSLFFPAPKRNLFPGRFLIFSGGKAEPRKGQDIVVAAFRIFARRHPEAVLVTAWHSHWPELARGMDLDLSAFPGRVIDTGALPNGLMAPIYRECDVALFPNRAEGGTNLVAMECLACGVPTILSDCTGHRDLLRLGLGHKLAQKPSRLWSEWGESDVDEVVEALEWAFCNARPSASCPPQLPQWSEATAALVGLARDIYETASAGSRRGSSEPVNETADFAALFAQAVQHHLQGRFPEAMDLYDRAIQLDAAVAPVHCNRGMALQSLGLADAALQSFDKAIALDPRFAEAHYNRGLVLRQLGRARDAIQSYDHAIGFKPDFAESYYNRGNALRDIKQPEAALESFAKAVDVKPDFADARVASGNTLLELGRHAAAIDCYDQAIRCKPDHAVAWCARGYALQELGRLHEAVDSYDHAIKHDPRFVEAHINRGKALQAAGRYEEALRSCDVAIELTPDSAEAHCHRGDALMNLGRSEAAVESYERAIRLQPLYAEAYSKRAGALAALGRSDAALDSHRTAAALNPALAGVDNSAR